MSTSPLLSLDRLVAAGTLFLHDCVLSPAVLSSKLEDDAGWSLFCPKQLLPLELHTEASTTPSKSRKKSKTARLLENLTLLCKHLFLRATWRCLEDGKGFLLRIYLIPVDLPGFQSQVIKPAMRMSREKAAEKLSKALREVLAETVVNERRWRGEMEGPSVERTVLDAAETHESLFSVWNSLESPTPCEIDCDEATREILEDALHSIGPPGLKSPLYEYQRRSLWKLLARELAPQRIKDATFASYRRSDGTIMPYYMDARCEVRLELDEYSDGRGGLLGEIMGTGKTIECLALILATKGRPALVENVANAVTPPCIRTELIDPTKLIGRLCDTFEGVLDDPYTDAPIEPIPVPSLLDYLVDYHRSSSIVPSSDVYSTLTTAQAKYEANLPFYYDQPPPDSGSLRSRRALAARDCSQRIYVSSATLCVVPNVLVSQWQAEVQKHVEEGALSVLTVVGQDDIPPPEQLARYDLVLMSLGRFSLAARKYYDALCACRLAIDTARRPATCTCSIAWIKSIIVPLLFCHFKRVIFDEGHIVGSETSLAVRLATQLRATSHWCVTGTPTQNLCSVGESSAPSKAKMGKTNDSTDGDDLTRLGHIIANFIRCPPFHGGIRSFDDFVRSPYLQQQAGAAGRVASLLGRIMVRNRESDVAATITLPPMAERVQSLEFDALGRRTYNVLLALFGINSVLTEREHQDYFFHPRQRKHLQAIMRNLTETQFWMASSEIVKSATEAIDRYKEELETRKTKFARMKPEDADLIARCVRCFEEAIADTEWCSAMQRGTLPMAVESMPQVVADAWDWSARLLSSSSLMAEDGASPIVSTSMWAEKVVEARRELQKLLETGTWQDDEELLEELATVGHNSSQVESYTAPKKAAELHKMKEVGLLAKKPLKADAAETAQARPFPSHSALHSPVVTRCYSPKINWVVDEVKRSEREDKFLIFTSSRQAIFFLAETMDIAGISYLLLVAEGIDAKRRERYIEQFQHDPNERVLIVDLALGSRGLTLTAANRVVFLEPVWQKDHEAQAKKRAHRVGQTRKVIVDTLVMKDAFEERMYARRSSLGGEDFRQLDKPTDDIELRDLLQTAPFLSSSGDAEQRWSQPVPLFPEGHLLPHYLGSRQRSNSFGAAPSLPPIPEADTPTTFTPPLSPSMTLTPQSSISSFPSSISTPASTPSMSQLAFAAMQLDSPTVSQMNVDVAPVIEVKPALRPSLKRSRSSSMLEECEVKKARKVGFA